VDPCPRALDLSTGLGTYIYINIYIYMRIWKACGSLENVSLAWKKLARPIWLAVCQRVTHCFPFS
jgi:hypothetical protein